MMIQLFLTALLGAIAVVVALQRTTSPVVRTSILAIIGIGGVFVWIPEQTNVLAAALGVGRGADLVLYLWVVITFGVILVLYLNFIRMGRRMTELTRAIALGQARRPDRADHEA